LISVTKVPVLPSGRILPFFGIFFYHKKGILKE
jgi:hypothetical protein